MYSPFRKVSAMTLQHPAYIPLTINGIGQYLAAGESEKFSFYSGQPFVQSKLELIYCGRRR